MFPTVLLVSDRPQFEDAWRSALASVDLSSRLVHPDALAGLLSTSLSESRSDSRSEAIGSLIIDAGSALYDEDELLAAVGLARAMRVTTAVSLPDGRTFASLEDLLEDLCSGLVVRPPANEEQLRRVASVLARRRDAERAKRFEYLTVSPRPGELLAVFGDGTATLLARPVSDQDDGSEVESITLQSDAQSATLKLGSGRELALRASMLTPVNGKHTPSVPPGSNGTNGTVAIDGARLGARLRELRLAAGLTQAELARRTGIHRPNIARVEAGRHTPSLETLARLATAIGVSTTVVLAEG